MENLVALLILSVSMVPVVFSAIALGILFPVPGKVARWLQLLLLVCAQCVLSSLVLGALDLLYAWLVFIANVLIAGGLLWLVNRHKPAVRGYGLRVLPGIVSRWFAQRPVSTCLIAAILLISIVNVVWAVMVAPLFGDAEAYHLARAYFWDRLGSLDHYATADARQVESPVNANLLQYWVIAFGGNHALTHLHQVVGLVLIILSTIELGRLCRVSALSSLLVAGIIISAPQLVLAATNGSNDLLTGGLGFATLVFGLRALGRARPGWKNDALLAGIAAGLAIGGKVTAILLIFGIACTLLAFLVTRRMPVKRFAVFVALTSAGVLLLGTYSYARNIIEFGHPVYSPTAQAEHGEIFRNDRRNPVQNIAVTMLQTPDLHGFAVGPFGSLREVERELVEAGLDIVNADETMKRGVLGYFDRATMRADWNGSGYGIIGFFIMLASPFVALIVLVRRKYRVRLLPAALAIAGGWVYLLVLSGVVPWNVTGEIRYFQAGFPLIAAGVLFCLTFLLSRKLVLILCFLSLAPLLYTTWSGGEAARMHGDVRYAKPFSGAIHYIYGGKQAENIELFEENFANTGPVGIWTRKHTYQYYFMRDMDEVDFVPVADSQLAAKVVSGELAAGLVSPLSELGDMAYLAVPTIFDRRRQFWLVVPEPSAFMQKNAVLYGLELADQDDSSFVSIAGQDMLTFLAETDSPERPEGGLLSPRWYRPVLVISAPTGALSRPAKTRRLEVNFNTAVPEGIEITAECGDRQAKAVLDDKRMQLTVRLPKGGCIDAKAGITRIYLDKSSGDRLDISSFSLQP